MTLPVSRWGFVAFGLIIVVNELDAGGALAFFPCFKFRVSLRSALSFAFGFTFLPADLNAGFQLGVEQWFHQKFQQRHDPSASDVRYRQNRQRNCRIDVS